MAKAKTARKNSTKIGRPPAKVDEARVAELAYKGLSNRKIAALVGISDVQLGERFRALLTKKRAELAEHVRVRQLEILDGAQGPGGATTMAIWLGKNILGQTDKAAVEHKGNMRFNVTFSGPTDEPDAESSQ